jgi:hypothetical protein
MTDDVNEMKGRKGRGKRSGEVDLKERKKMKRN